MLGRDFIGNHLEKVEALAATGMPGAYKVLIFFLLQELFDFSLLGSVASWQSIAQIFGFFTAIGWSSLVMVRVAKANTKKDRVEVFNRLTMMGGLTLLLCTTSVMLIGGLTEKVEDAVQISCWLAAWTAYQLPRHYLIALKQYRKALYLDAGVISLSVCSLLVASAGNISLGLALSMLVAGLVAFLLIQKDSKTGLPSLGYEMKGLEFGLVNFLSGGISLSLIPLAAYLEGEAFAGVLTLFISITGIALLIPRAISLNQLPKVSQVIHDSKSVAMHIKHMGRQISLSNVFTSLVCLAIAVFMLLQAPEALTTNMLAPVFILIILQSTLGTQGLVYANILMAMEDSRYSLKINFIISAIFFSVATVAIFTSVDIPFLYLCLTVVILSFYRFYRIKHYAKSKHDSHPTL